MTSARRTVRRLIDYFLVWYAVAAFLMFQKPPGFGQRMALLRLHCATNATFTVALAAMLAKIFGSRAKGSVSGVLGNLSIETQERIVGALESDGFYVFDTKLPDELCDEIEKLARNTPAKFQYVKIGQEELDGELGLFDQFNPKSKNYRLREQDIIKNSAIQKIMADPSLLSIAESYIGATPSLSMLNLWWSPFVDGVPSDDAAQTFHFDFDPPPKWIQFFVYLTDVGPDNGPHIYVKGSHRAGNPAAKEILSRGYVRIPDEDIEKSFGKENVIEFQGRRGTILAIDGRGFHKGKTPTAGYRLIAQFTYSLPVFSGAHSKGATLADFEITSDLRNAAKQLPRVYSRYVS